MRRENWKKEKAFKLKKKVWASLNRPILTCGCDPPPRIEPTDSGTVVYMTQHAITTELRCLYAVEKVWFRMIFEVAPSVPDARE